MKRTFLILCLAIAAAAVSCEKVDSPETPVQEFVPIVLTKAQEQMSRDINAFGFNLNSQMEQNNHYGGKDRFISPYSASLALSLLSTGAQGNTASQINSMLGFSKVSTQEMDDFYALMTKSLVAVDPSATFESANSIWAAKGLTLKDGYVADAKKYFDAEVDSFSGNEDVPRINKWCSDKTHGKITEIIKDLGAARAVLLNALYFNASWAFEDTPNVKKDWFRCLGSSRVKKEFFSTSGTFSYAEDDRFEMVRVPYGNGAFEMDVLLPKKFDGISAFSSDVNALTSERFEKLCGGSRPTKVILTMPKFRIESGEMELNDYLKALGMKDAFAAAADFSLISDEPLSVSKVLQKTYIDVTEKGTEAAAVTAIMILTSASPSAASGPKEFKADRPFIFVIREQSTGAVLFIGQKVE